MTIQDRTYSHHAARQRDNAACVPASCINGKCQATGECACPPWPKTDREWARGETWPEVSADEARRIDSLVASEFATGDWVPVEMESPPLVPTSTYVSNRVFDGTRPISKIHVDRLLTNYQRTHGEQTPAAAASQRTIIAFTGLAGSGKSTAAAHLVKHRGFERVRFAGPLKAMLAALGCTAREVDGDLKETPCDLLCGKTPRQAMQWLGTEYGRNMLGPDLWIRAWNAALAKVPAGVPVVVDDCRFPNEATTVTAAGGIIVRVVRPGAGAGAAGHSSEGQALHWSRTIHNTLSEQNLREQVDTLLGDLSWGTSLGRIRPKVVAAS